MHHIVQDLDWDILEGIIAKFIENSRLPYEINWKTELSSIFNKILNRSKMLVIDIEFCLKSYWEKMKEIERYQIFHNK